MTRTEKFNEININFLKDCAYKFNAAMIGINRNLILGDENKSFSYYYLSQMYKIKYFLEIKTYKKAKEELEILLGGIMKYPPNDETYQLAEDISFDLNEWEDE